VRDLVAALAIVVGVFFMFVASLGLLRFPDFYLRVHAPTKAATLGLFALVGALLAAVPDVREAEALLAALFIGATIPVSAHVLLRGAYRSGLRPANTRVDEYGDTAASSAQETPTKEP
jgi:multicomponent Na+:H+ antiporter subunit G